MNFLSTVRTARRVAMKNWIFVLIAVLSLASSGQAADNGVEGGVSSDLVSRWQLVSGIQDRLVGRVLGSLIRPGMHGEQVDQIVGHLLVDRGQFGPGSGFWAGYSRYGFYICYTRDDADPQEPWRVSSVGYWSLFRGD
jgi:hypothetical protein